jgi:hypothetical protein
MAERFSGVLENGRARRGAEIEANDAELTGNGLVAIIRDTTESRDLCDALRARSACDRLRRYAQQWHKRIKDKVTIGNLGVEKRES